MCKVLYQDNMAIGKAKGGSVDNHRDNVRDGEFSEELLRNPGTERFTSYWSLISGEADIL